MDFIKEYYFVATDKMPQSHKVHKGKPALSGMVQLIYNLQSKFKSKVLNHDRRGPTTTIADSRDTKGSVVLFENVYQCSDNSGSRRTERMAKRYSAAIYIDIF